MARFHVDMDAKTGKVATTPCTAQEEADADAAETAAANAASAAAADATLKQSVLLNSRRQALVTTIHGSTDAQLVTFITNNVTDLPSARTMLINLALLVAGVIRN